MGRLPCRGGRLMLSVITAVTATGVGGRWAGNRCLQMLAHQPGPMGGEVCELIKQRDPESPLLRWVLRLSQSCFLGHHCVTGQQGAH